MWLYKYVVIAAMYWSWIAFLQWRELLLAPSAVLSRRLLVLNTIAALRVTAGALLALLHRSSGGGCARRTVLLGLQNVSK
jgi:hypothetical protein